MRISDDRYNRDRLRFDLAMRMMRHSARTSTICAWTGLTPDRVRKLYRAYLLHQTKGAVPRRRGKSPSQTGWFMQSAALSFEATTLGCLFSILGLLSNNTRPPQTRSKARMLETPEQAETFCEAYETYAALHTPARLSFEHGCFLLQHLQAKHSLKLLPCPRCGRLYLTDTIRIATADCGCGKQHPGWPRHLRMPSKQISGSS